MTVPKAFAAAEKNPTLAKWAKALQQKYSPKKMDPLFDAVDFGWGLLALGRKAEAKALMTEISSAIVFSGNFNVWTPTAHAICLLARLSTPAQRKKAIARVVEHPALAEMGESGFLEWVEREVRTLSAAIEDPKSRAGALARALQAVDYFAQTAGNGFYYDRWIDVAGLETTIQAGLKELGRRLA